MFAPRKNKKKNIILNCNAKFYCDHIRNIVKNQKEHIK
jgi:hypothetical protein